MQKEWSGGNFTTLLQHMRDICVLNQSPNVSTKFGEDRFNSKEMATIILSLFDVIDVFEIKVAVVLLNLAMIGEIVKKWQPFFNIQDGGDHHLGFLQQCISDVIHRYIPNQRRNISSKFDGDQSICNEMATVFRNPRWRPRWFVMSANRHERLH